MQATLLASALLTVALLAAGCAPLTRRTPLTEQEAIALAVNLANQEARSRFKTAPFTAESGDLRLVEGRWRWQALTNVKGAGREARSATVRATTWAIRRIPSGSSLSEVAVGRW